ncbi:MAG: c-type cytochrome [Opitutaceae bacterium]|nr:c-type cytochrome [Opitutaceae bacterium]
MPAASAQMGDRPNDDAQRPPPPEWNVSPARPLPPDVALRSFVVPPGFKVELVATEPLVQDPVAFAFDRRGRLFVAELPAYNAEILRDLPVYLEKGKPVPPTPVGRVVCLEDTNGDGRMDKRTVYADNLVVPRSVGFIGDAVLIGDPPNLWLFRDRNNDGVADEKTAIANDYGTVAAIETSPNGLLWGRDNWLYNAAYKWRLRFVGGEWRGEAMPELGQYGITQDDAGRLFYDHNSDQLRANFLPPHYVGDYPRNARFNTFNFQIATDQQVFPIRPTPGTNRGYRKGFLREDGTLVAFTAASAPVIYRGANFPARFYGNAFVPEPASNSIKRNLVLEAEGRLTALNGFEQADFMASTDERFRPVFLGDGPDGALYVADLYRGILEGYNFVTTFLKEQILARELNRPLWGMGRIYRVVYPERPRAPRIDFAHLTPTQCVARLRDENGWTRDTAQRVIVDSGAADYVGPLRSLFAARDATERDRLYALWALEGLWAIAPDFLATALADPSAKVRMAAVRAAEPWLGRPEGAPLVTQLAGRVATEEPEVLAQAVLSLSRKPTDPAREAIFAALPRVSEHPALLDAVLIAFRGEEGLLLERLIASARGGALPPFGHRAIFRSVGSAIATSAARPGHEGLVAALLDPQVPEAVRIALMQGLVPAAETEGRRRPAPRTRIDAALLDRIAAGAPDLVVRKNAQGLLDALRQEKARLAKRGTVPPLTAGQKASFELGRTNFLLCAACHQPAGEGKEGVAPSLQNSRWATHVSPEFALRIVLHGKEGSPGFPGAMAPLGVLSDEQIAGIMTFVRRSWGNEASAVSSADVARVRAQTKDRAAAWTDTELERIESAK